MKVDNLKTTVFQLLTVVLLALSIFFSVYNNFINRHNQQILEDRTRRFTVIEEQHDEIILRQKNIEQALQAKE